MKTVLAIVAGSVLLVVGVVLLIAAAASDGPACPPGKHLFPLVVGKVIVPTCM